MESYRFTLGQFGCIAIKDGETTYVADKYVTNVALEQVRAALQEHGVDPDAIPSPYSGLVIDTGQHRVLIDTGAGNIAPGLGNLLANLRMSGITPEEIDTVVLTHGHPDHLGGTTDAAGNVVFRNARHVLRRAEWEYWYSEVVFASELNRQFVDYARKNLDPLGDQLELLDQETEIVPGIHAIAAPGHTPGQLAVAIVSGTEQLLYISDAALHPIHLEHPDWYPVYDLDPQQALLSKRQLFDRAAADGALVLAFHFDPFPSLGHVVARGSGWAWQPIELGRSAAAGSR